MVQIEDDNPATRFEAELESAYRTLEFRFAR
jgi:hypothetical protein